ncbi:MAG: phosphoribosyl-ATP diphosphatase [Gammaproteobacteria bacterium]|nr:phosphoribosyl-ATP diphosphatase [Gammaproteobacteria bacterium]
MTTTSTNSSDTLQALMAVINERRQADPAHSYVASLLQDNEDKVLKKIGEEAVEVVLAAKSTDVSAIIHETADLWFHTLVLLARHDLAATDVLTELRRRFGVSGHEEKRNRK